MFLIKRLFNKEYATRLGKLKCRKIIQSLNIQGLDIQGQTSKYSKFNELL